jgi:5-hydroxyisourate hydrolase-like protein (transthyretin family)
MFFCGCANIVQPQGGARDTMPPKIDSMRSTPFGQTNFKGKQIVIDFDEWITLQNPQEILISPPLKRRPDISIKNKMVVVKWTDTLRENTTYNINFGKSVQDFTEGNPAQNLRMTFSTGSEIDTLRLRGNVLNALTGEPIKDVLVQLYDTFGDSIVRKALPNYFTITDETGSFTIENIKAGNYKIIALKDVNSNYKYDQDDESIAFSDKKIAIPTKESVKLTLFDTEKPLKVQLTKANQYGRTEIVFTRPPTDVKIRFTTKTPFKTSIKADTMTVWHKAEGKQMILVEMPKQARPDTVRFSVPLRSELRTKLRPLNVALSGIAFRKQGNKSQAKTPATYKSSTLQNLISNEFKIDFGRPLATFDASKFVLTDSSKKVLAVKPSLDAENLGVLKLNADFAIGMPYRLEILPDALQDEYNISNDTIIYTSLKLLSKKELGKIILKIKQLDDTKFYILEVTDATQKLIKMIPIQNKKEFTTTLSDMIPNNYGFRLITDDNKNGLYDTGNYYERRQPENIQTVAPQALRANWELELTNESKKGKK